jgi:uncharacterized protein (TIGR02246 family)
MERASAFAPTHLVRSRTLQSADDENAIRSLAAAYADAVNRRDAAGMVEVFAPDGVIEKPGFGDPVQGVEKIAKRYQRLQRERDFLCQMIYSGVVEIDGDRATARWWFGEIKKPAGGDDWLYMIGVYQDEIIRLPIGWRFARRVQTTILNQSLPSGGNCTAYPLPPFFALTGLPVR